MRWLLLSVLPLLCGCTLRDPKVDDHAAKMFANIIITARAQKHETPPPVQQTAQAIETAAQAGLDVMGYELDE